MFVDRNAKRFFDMLKSIDDLSGVGDGLKRGEVRKNDLTFIDTSLTEGDGFVYLVQVKDEKPATYKRVYWTGDTITLCCPTDGEAEEHPAEDVTIQGRVTGIYRELPNVPMIDPGEYAPMFKQIEKANTGNYRIRLDQVAAIAAKNKGFSWGCISDAYRLGFLKGQRAEKKRQRNKGGAA